MEENRVIAETFYQRFLAEVQTPENYNEVMRGVQKISAFMKAEKISSMDI